jgi:hypothetical protein
MASAVSRLIVARSAGRQGGLKPGAVKACGESVAEAQDSGKRCVQRLAIAGIGDAFAGADHPIALQFHADNLRFGLAAAGDGEAAGDRKAFDLGAEGGRGHIGCTWGSG